MNIKEALEIVNRPNFIVTKCERDSHCELVYDSAYATGYLEAVEQHKPLVEALNQMRIYAHLPGRCKEIAKEVLSECKKIMGEEGR